MKRTYWKLVIGPFIVSLGCVMALADGIIGSASIVMFGVGLAVSAIGWIDAFSGLYCPDGKNHIWKDSEWKDQSIQLEYGVANWHYQDQLCVRCGATSETGYMEGK